MVGAGVLLECLDDPRVTEVVSITRRAGSVSHAKLREVIHADFYNYDGLAPTFAKIDACFFCIGVTSAGMNEADYTRLTHDLTAAAGKALSAANPNMTICFVSGTGTDSTEKGPIMWARVKGKAENALLALPFRAAYMFRPGIIQPLRGVQSSTRIYRIFYKSFGFLFPVFRKLWPRSITTSVIIGRAMIRVALDGYPKKILEMEDINRAGQAIE
jgi:hypothetical protein